MYVTTHSKSREDWCEWWTKMAAYVFKMSKKDCILSKLNFSFAKGHWVIYRIRQENQTFDDMVQAQQFELFTYFYICKKGRQFKFFIMLC